MALTYSKFFWGWEVFDGGTSQNNKLDFYISPGPVATATLNAGVYTAKEFATEVQRAIRVATGTTNQTCAFDFGTGQFTLTNNVVWELRFGTGPNAAVDCNGLLGFAASDTPSQVQHVGVPAGSTLPTSTAFSWTMAEPNSRNTPVTPAAAGTGAALLQRRVRAIQNVSDGGKVETIHIHTMKKVMIGFRALSASEQVKMESLLDWIVTGKRFTWQPDSASPNALYLVMGNPAEINNDFTWLTRSETDYGDLTFFEQLT